MDTEIFANARWLIAALARQLNRNGGQAVLDHLAGQPLDHNSFRLPGSGLPAPGALAEAVGCLMAGDPDLAAAIAAVEDQLQWADGGTCEVIGPSGFFSGGGIRLGLCVGNEIPGDYHLSLTQEGPLFAVWVAGA